MQAIYGTDKIKGRGIIASSDVTISMVDTITKWNKSITNDTNYYLCPASENDVNNIGKKIYTLTSDKSNVYIMCTVYDNQKDVKHRWNSETHALVLDSKKLDEPEEFLYLDKNQLNPLASELSDILNIQSIECISTKSAMMQYGFYIDNIGFTEMYIKLMKCVYTVLCKKDDGAQTLYIKVKSEEDVLPCLQSIYYGMPYSMRTYISAANVPMHSVVISFVTPEYYDIIPENSKLFDIISGKTNVSENKISHYCFERLMMQPSYIQDKLSKIESCIKENWNNIENHYKFLSLYLLGDENKSSPEKNSDIEKEHIIGSLASIRNSCTEIDDILYSYIQYCKETKYSIKSPRLFSILQMKIENLRKNRTNSKQDELIELIRFYITSLLVKEHPDMQLNRLEKIYAANENNDLFLDEVKYCCVFLSDENFKIGFVDELIYEHIIKYFRSEITFSNLHNLFDLCLQISNRCGIQFKTLEKTYRNIINYAVYLFDTSYYNRPTELKKYIDDEYKDNLYKFSPHVYEEIFPIICRNFWKSLSPSEYHLWLENNKAFSSLKLMTTGDNQTPLSCELINAHESIKKISYIFQDATKKIRDPANYSLEIVNYITHDLLSEISTILDNPNLDISTAIAKILFNKIFEETSEIISFFNELPERDCAFFYIELLHIICFFYDVQEDIFTICEQSLNFLLIESLTPYDIASLNNEDLQSFYIEQLRMKIESCQSNSYKMYSNYEAKITSEKRHYDSAQKKTKRKSQRTENKKIKESNTNHMNHFINKVVGVFKKEG